MLACSAGKAFFFKTMTIAEEYEEERERLERNRAFDWSTFGMVYKAAEIGRAFV